MASTTVTPLPSSPLLLSDFLSSVPNQLTAALLALTPYITFLVNLLRVASWSTSWLDSWLALAAWWAMCLLIGPFIRYFLPFACAACLITTRWTVKKSPPLVTEHALQAIISDLTVIHSLLPSSPVVPLQEIGHTMRICTILYIPYILLTYYVSLRIIVALAGTAILTWRAPWAVVLRSTIWRSAWIRWAFYHIWSCISGRPLPTLASCPQPTAAAVAPMPVNSLRYLFTVYENQRWWVGLDWTAALLPNDRPSWCTAAQNAVSPPNAFVLPDNTTVFLPNAKGKRIKRTATWHWEEPEWRVLIRREGTGLSRVERPLPSIAEQHSASGGNRPLRAGGRLREGGVNVAISTQEKCRTSSLIAESEHVADDSTDEGAAEDPVTDVDGWVYGDNKWEGESARGGMGKYTRYRGWTRVAVVSETVEVVDDGDIGILRQPSVIISEPSPVLAPPDSNKSDSFPNSSSDTPLRRRLQAALSKTTKASP